MFCFTKLACSFDRPLFLSGLISRFCFLFSTKIYTFIFQFFFFLLINMILYLLLNRVLCFAMLFFLCVCVYFFFFKVHNLPDVVRGVVRNADDKNFWFPLFSFLFFVCVECYFNVTCFCSKYYFVLNFTYFFAVWEFVWVVFSIFRENFSIFRFFLYDDFSGFCFVVFS